ncbi:acid-sensing ion channel 1B-like [Antedon mediterranea]|uniref:acid-sensing ion channel 1B-like n=1 Tax=Antedon mediterranea TaxID=105859 RepID=UPI003AF9141C
MTRDEIKKNLGELNIFYQSLRVENSVMVYDYDINSLFSDLGGSFGLCIGASLLTMLEFVELFCFKFYRCRGKKNER